ncbi:molybdate ABC transporter substrate-binding protein [Micrococcales bacterium 31B]|nr:molybdate ABC transporter substrate-binding protein [Micrococcales bacterium 31B]
MYSPATTSKATRGTPRGASRPALLRSLALPVLGLTLLAPGLTACQPTGASGAASASAENSVTEVQLFAAQSLVDVMPKLITAYQDTRPGVRVVASFGGSGTLAAQINEGAPADIFLAADTTSSRSITRALATSTLIASNRLVLVVPSDNPAGIKSAADLPGTRVALCAATVPCGRSAATFLRDENVSLTGASEETDVRSVLAKVTSGQADAGFVYATDASAAGTAVRSLELPHAPVNHYEASVVADTASAQRSEATAFVRWLAGDEAQSILSAAGFSAP